MRVTDENGVELNAEFAVETDGHHLLVVLESAGGKSPHGGHPRNHEYVPALRLLLTRLRDRRAVLESAVVASSRLSALPESERILVREPVNLVDVADIERLRLDITRAQGRIGMPEGAAKEGNNRKRIHLRLSVPDYGPQDASRLANDLAARPGSGAQHDLPTTKVSDAGGPSISPNDPTVRPRHWLLQCNPKIWDVWTWWESGARDLDRWTVARFLKDMRAGDHFAFWISGPGAGMYATGTLTSSPHATTEFDDYWNSPPTEAHIVDLQFDRYLFDNPVTKASLVSTPEFAESLIIRMPGYGNPIPLTPEQWLVLSEAADRHGHAERPNRSEVIVTSRPLGNVPSETTTSSPARDRAIRYPEAKLVKEYQEHLGRELRCLAALLPSGERLICDAFDPQHRMIIEAKASNSRSDVRMAVGQLLDYQHHIDPSASIAILLPAQPSTSIIELLRAHGVKLIYKSGASFEGAN